MLSFVPTPIGNLGDLTLRSLQVLQEAELFFCEDTRVTKKLLNLISQNHQIEFNAKSFTSLHSHNEKEIISKIDIETLKNKNVVYVSDAGMPCISDPGALLVNFCQENDIKYEVLPGANAVLSAYAMSGFIGSEFTFFGFLDHKGNSRKDKLSIVLNCDKIAILYESPHRLLKLLSEIVSINETKQIFLVKEITKKFERYYKGSAKEIFEEIKNEEIKGEWVVVFEKVENENGGSAITLDDIMELKLPAKQKAKLISKLTGANIKEVYKNLTNEDE